VTRVTDHVHHWEDVTVGAFVGALVGFYLVSNAKSRICDLCNSDCISFPKNILRNRFF